MTCCNTLQVEQQTRFKQDACLGVTPPAKQKMGTSEHLCIIAQVRKNMKWLTRDLAKEFLLRFPPPLPLTLLRTYSGPKIQGNLGKLYIIKAYGS